jgi:hypothetical protein
MKSVVMIVRTFFNNAGHTVHSVNVIVDGKFIGRSTGTGPRSNAEHSGMEILESEGMLVDWKENGNRGYEVPFRYFEKHGVNFYSEEIKVCRKKDM